MAKYLLKFEVVSDHPHEEGKVQDQFEHIVQVWPWTNLSEIIYDIKEAHAPVGYWSDVNLVDCIKL